MRAQFQEKFQISEYITVSKLQVGHTVTLTMLQWLPVIVLLDITVHRVLSPPPHPVKSLQGHVLQAIIVQRLQLTPYHVSQAHTITRR